MPTDRPRLTITLTPRTSAALAAGAKAMGKSKGAVVLELIDGIAPMLERLAEARQAVERATPAQQAEIAKRAPAFMAALEAAQSSASGTANSALATLDLFAGREPEKAAVPRRGTAAGGGDRRRSGPPSVNKGGETRREGGKVIQLSKRGGRK